MLRFTALTTAQNRKPVAVPENGKRSELFAQNVFNEEAMRQLMTRDAFAAVMNAIHNGTKIDRRVADQVATAMRDWAILQRRYPLYPLVPTSYRRHCRKTRRFL
jgi:glutamate--ammonia ligase